MTYMHCSEWEKCTQCGQCLQRCPVMQLPADEAKSEIRRLINGEPTRRVLNDCTLCYNCNQYCPTEELRPYELILQRMLEKRGRVPEFVKYFINGMPGPNLFTDVYAGLSSSEKDILKKWSIPPDACDEILFIGCMGKMSPLNIEHSGILKDLPKFGPADVCCGELAYRLGSWQTYSGVVERAIKRFEKLDIRRMVCYCGSCYNYFSNILPKVYGKQLPFQITSMYEWMWEKVRNGELLLKKPIQRQLAVYESCYVSELGDAFRDSLLKLYEAAGADLVMLKHQGDENLSCGFVSMARKNNFIAAYLSMKKEQKKKYKEVKESGVSDMALNCPGCYVGFRFANLFGAGKLFYMPDVLMEAYGDSIVTPISKSFNRIFMAMNRRMPRLLLHKRHESLPPVPSQGPISADYAPFLHVYPK